HTFWTPSAALAGAHDLDAVARAQRGLRPGRARDHGAVERNRDAALAHVDCLLLQQDGERGGGERLALAVDVDAGPLDSVSHVVSLLLGGARQGKPLDA